MHLASRGSSVRTFVFLDRSEINEKKNTLFHNTVKILKFGTPQTIAIIVLKIERFDVTLH